MIHQAVRIFITMRRLMKMNPSRNECVMAGLVVSILLFAAVTASGAPLPVAQAVHADNAIKIDGRLDESVWHRAPRYGDFHRLSRRGGSTAELERTEFQVAFDDEALIVAVVCYEPRMDDLVAHATQRDGPAWSDDAVEIFITPDDRYYYQFAINNIATCYDARIPIPQGDAPPDLARSRLWDGVWEAAVTHEKDRWVLEARIPFATLGLNSQTHASWRFNIGRTAARRKDFSSWAPVERGFHDLPRHGSLEGLSVDTRRFVLDSSHLVFPPLFMGENLIEVSLPARDAGPFTIKTSLRPWAPGPLPPRRVQAQSVVATAGQLPVSLRVPVAAADTLMELVLEIVDAQAHQPALLRAHLFQAPQPMNASLDWAVYYASETHAKLSVELSVAAGSAQGDLVASIFRDDTLLAQHHVPVEGRREIQMPLPLAELPVGRYRLQVAAHLAGLEPVTKQLLFHVVRAPFSNTMPDR